jgi:murein DD-endopeptidase MepM/ murein hydrolase activator NlpD
MTYRIPSFLPAEWSGKGLLLISLLILPVPFLRNVAHTPEAARLPGTFEAIDNAARLSRILASLREIRHTAERSAAQASTTLTSLGSGTPKAIPAGLPLSGTVSSGFGLRRDPFSGFPEFHKGIDIAAARGTPVSATADGHVVRAGWEGDYGKSIILRHSRGHATRYAHLDRVLVRRGDPVCKGTVIGTVGDTGRATGTHLHYEVLRDGKRTNPRTYMLGGTVGRKERGQ